MSDCFFFNKSLPRDQGGVAGNVLGGHRALIVFKPKKIVLLFGSRLLEKQHHQVLTPIWK